MALGGHAQCRRSCIMTTGLVIVFVTASRSASCVTACGLLKSLYSPGILQVAVLKSASLVPSRHQYQI